MTPRPPPARGVPFERCRYVRTRPGGRRAGVRCTRCRAHGGPTDRRVVPQRVRQDALPRDGPRQRGWSGRVDREPQIVHQHGGDLVRLHLGCDPAAVRSRRVHQRPGRGRRRPGGDGHRKIRCQPLENDRVENAGHDGRPDWCAGGPPRGRAAGVTTATSVPAVVWMAITTRRRTISPSYVTCGRSLPTSDPTSAAATRCGRSRGVAGGRRRMAAAGRRQRHREHRQHPDRDSSSHVPAGNPGRYTGG